MLLHTKLSTRSLQTYFSQVERIYSRIVHISLFDKNKIPYQQLRDYAEELYDIQIRVFEYGTLNTGCMYKAGIMTGVIGALNLLKEEFYVEPNAAKK